MAQFPNQHLKDKHFLLDQYKDIWNQTVAPAQSADDISDVLDLLERGAAISVRIKETLQSEGKTVVFPETLQYVQKFFADVAETGDNPQGQPLHFIRELVHNTYKDDSGYILSLDEDSLNFAIEQYLHKREEVRITLHQLREKWENLCANFINLMPEEKLWTHYKTEKVMMALEYLEVQLQAVKGGVLKETVKGDLSKAGHKLEQISTK